MNERIAELAKQAYGVDDAKPLHPSALVALDAFAKLIVKECAELSVNSQYANTKSEYYEGFNEALIYAGNKIRKHFGVE